MKIIINCLLITILHHDKMTQYCLVSFSNTGIIENVMRLLFLVEGHSHGTQPLKRTVTSKLSYEWIFTVVCYLCFNENVPIAVPVLPFPNTERIEQFFSWLDQLPPTIKKKKKFSTSFSNPVYQVPVTSSNSHFFLWNH